MTFISVLAVHFKPVGEKKAKYWIFTVSFTLLFSVLLFNLCVQCPFTYKLLLLFLHFFLHDLSFQHVM